MGDPTESWHATPLNCAVSLINTAVGICGPHFLQGLIQCWSTDALLTVQTCSTDAKGSYGVITVIGFWFLDDLC